MAISSIGAVGKNYTTLTLWADDKKTSAEAEIAELHEDIVDNLTFNGWSNSVAITIRSNVTGTKRTITADAASSVISVNDLSLIDYTFQDLVLDADSGASASGIIVSTGGDAIVIDRVTFKNAGTSASGLQYGGIESDTIDMDNCIFKDNAGAGFRNSNASGTTVATFSNCLFVDNTGDGLDPGAFGGNTHNIRNCLAFGNGVDYDGAGDAGVTNILDSVSQDSSATDAHDNVTGSVSGFTETGSYFIDYGGGDYTLKQSDICAWGIEGSDDATPATDYDNTTRVANSIGPFEYVAGVVLVSSNIHSDGTNAKISKVQFGETVTNGLLVYRKIADNKYYTAIATGTEEEAQFAGIVINENTTDRYGLICTLGKVNLGSVLLVGQPYSLSGDFDGLLHCPADGISGQRVTHCGYAITDSILKVNPIPNITVRT